MELLVPADINFRSGFRLEFIKVGYVVCVAVSDENGSDVELASLGEFQHARNRRSGVKRRGLAGFRIKYQVGIDGHVLVGAREHRKAIHFHRFGIPRLSPQVDQRIGSKIQRSGDFARCFRIESAAFEMAKLGRRDGGTTGKFGIAQTEAALRLSDDIRVIVFQWY